MNDSKPDVVIVGSGLSGIVAARMLAEHSLNVMMVDENIHVGGQLLRRLPEALGRDAAYHPDPVKRAGFQFIDSLKTLRIDVRNRTRVLGVYPGPELLLEEGEARVFRVRPRLVLFSTGARERFVPFKGWTLPGVVSAGAVQVLLKSSGVLPARRMLVGGAGLFLFAAAYEILRHGGKVEAVLEQTPLLPKAIMLTQFFRQFSKFAEGARFLGRIAMSGTPVHYRTRILEARGERDLQAVVTARVDRHGAPIPGSEKTYPLRSLAVGYGFVPNVELPHLAGCRLEHDAAKGGWVVRVNERLETSCENILAAGEITGIAGALKSITEGRIASWTILFRLGKTSEHDYLNRLSGLIRERHSHLQFGRYFNSLYRVPPRATLDAPDDTIVCRCEDVTVGEIKRAIAEGYRTPQALKIKTRVSMGDCQGRTCGAAVYDILDAFGHIAPGDMEPFHARPPVKPAELGSLATISPPAPY